MSMDMQKQIRDNTLEFNEFLKDLKGWEQTVKEKEKKIQGKGSSKENRDSTIGNPPRQNPSSSELEVNKLRETKNKKEEIKTKPAKGVKRQDEIKEQGGACAKSGSTAAGHTYDHFREKWDNFDVDAALNEVDEESDDERPVKKVPKTELPPPRRQPAKTVTDKGSGGIREAPVSPLKEGKMFSKGGNRSDPVDQHAGSYGFDDAPPDAASEKDLGNEYFKEGKYIRAIDCYSRSIALQPTAVAYANRAMAALKIRRFDDAELDCSEAIVLDDRYTKAFARRGTARRELKRYRDAVEDFEFALRLEPDNKELMKQYTEAEELYQKETGLKRPHQRKEESKGKKDPQSPPPPPKSTKAFQKEEKEEKKEMPPPLSTIPKSPVVVENEKKDGKKEFNKSEPQPMAENLSAVLENARKEKKTEPPLLPMTTKSSSVVEDSPKDSVLPSDISTDTSLKISPRKESSNGDSMGAQSTLSKPLNGEELRPNATDSSPKVGGHKSEARGRDKKQANAAALTQAAAARAAASAMAAVSHNIAAPKSAYEFELSWKGFGGNQASQVQLLKKMDPLSMPKVFKDSLSAPLLLEILHSLEGFFPEDAKSAVLILDNLTRVGRFSMTVMFLTSSNKTGLKQLWERVFMTAPNELHTQLKSLQASYRLV